MKLHIGLTNYGASYELDRLARSESGPLVELLTTEIDRYGLLKHQPVNHLWIHYDVYSEQKGMAFFPHNYPQALQTRQLVRLQEYEASCAVDWTDWKPRHRTKAGLERFPEANEVRARLEAYSRVVIVQVALELGDSVARASALLGDAPLIQSVDIARAVERKRRTKRSSKRKDHKPTIPLEVTFPFTYDRSDVRDLLEAVVLAEKIGRLDGWSSGPQHYEVGLVVADVDLAVRAIKGALAANGYDHNVFGFEAED